MTRYIVDLSETPRDRRFKCWTKILSGVDPNKSDGYAFEGQFISNDRKQELEEGTLLLHYWESGSAKYHHPCISLYQVSEKSGKNYEHMRVLYNREDLSRSWALDVRDEIIAVIAKAKAAATTETATPTFSEAEQTLIDALLQLPPDRQAAVVESLKHRGQ